MRRQSADRRIHDREAALSSSPSNQVGRPGFDGAHIDDDLVRSGVSQDPVRPEHSEFDLRRCGQHREHDVRTLRNACHAVRRPGADSFECTHRLGIYVVDKELEALATQVRSHAASHATEPDEANLIH